jgi:hypothetical protein
LDIQALQKKEIQDYIQKHQHDNIQNLALKLGKEKHPLANEILSQVKGRQLAKNKIPQWQKEGIIFPAAVSLEQCSSEQTARFKASLISGNTLIDLSAGFGVDSRYFSGRFEKVLLVEPNKELQEIVQHNYKIFDIPNAIFENKEAGAFLNEFRGKADYIYVDPSRRDDLNRRLFKLSECQPNVPELLEKMFSIAPNALIKAAPFLDIHAALDELRGVKEVIVLALHNEVKEVLYLLEKDFIGEPQIKAVDITKSGEKGFCFTYEEEKAAEANLSPPLQYLYEPNAAIMKTGAFKSIGNRFGLDKLHQHSHLYTSAELSPDFPGRAFRIIAQCSPDKKAIKKALPEMKANVSLRNYQGSVSDFLKKTGIKEGGSIYLFATTLADNKPAVLICEKVS